MAVSDCRSGANAGHCSAIHERSQNHDLSKIWLRNINGTLHFVWFIFRACEVRSLFFGCTSGPSPGLHRSFSITSNISIHGLNIFWVLFFESTSTDFADRFVSGRSTWRFRWSQCYVEALVRSLDSIHYPF